MILVSQDREPGRLSRRPDSARLVSIAMPVYNCGPTLARAIRSVLHQTYEDWRLLLIDDGSTDCSVSIARAFSDPRIRVMTDGKHRGLVARLNQAIDMAEGRYLARMDGDDVAFPNRLERQVEFLEEHPQVDLVGSGVVVFRNDGEVLGTRPIYLGHTEICRRPWLGFPLAHPTWTGRTEWFRAYRYRTAAVRAEDHELLLRSYRTSQFVCLPEILLGYQESTLSLKKILRGRYSFAKAAFEEFARRGEILTAMRGVLGQVARGCVDTFAITTGLDYRILRHRARPATPEIVRRWQSVFAELEESGAQCQTVSAAHSTASSRMSARHS
jgi:glycosyltransferase involved in cell wall biosynthesis